MKKPLLPEEISGFCLGIVPVSACCLGRFFGRLGNLDEDGRHQQAQLEQ
ncbi:hypothetical protein IWX79_003386 [Janthinobacterium sp. CAN_S1]